MIGRDFTVFGRDKEVGVILLTADFDVGFITGLGIIDIALIFQVKEMAIVSGGLGIVKDSLIRGGDRKNVS